MISSLALLSPRHIFRIGRSCKRQLKSSLFRRASRSIVKIKRRYVGQQIATSCLLPGKLLQHLGRRLTRRRTKLADSRETRASRASDALRGKGEEPGNPGKQRLLRITEARSLIHRLERTRRGGRGAGERTGSQSSFPIPREEEYQRGDADATRNCMRGAVAIAITRAGALCFSSKWNNDDDKRRNSHNVRLGLRNVGRKEGRKEGKLHRSNSNARLLALALARLSLPLSFSLSLSLSSSFPRASRKPRIKRRA
jgi:hypothetical protein